MKSKNNYSDFENKLLPSFSLSEKIKKVKVNLLTNSKSNINNSNYNIIKSNQYFSFYDQDEISEINDNKNIDKEEINIEYKNEFIKNESSKFVFSHDRIFILILYMISYLIIIISYISLLISFAFNIYYSRYINIIRIVTDTYLILLILIKFNTTIYKDGKVQNNRRFLAKAYLKSWFIFDFLMAFPYYILISPSNYFNIHYSDSDFISQYQFILPGNKILYINRTKGIIIQILYYMNLLKLLRVLKISYFLKHIQKYSHSSIFSLFYHVELLSKVILFSHFSICLWIKIGISEQNNKGSSWLNCGSYDFSDSSSTEKYIAGMYFFTTTITTIGYGDLIPNTILEKIVVVLLMIIATCLYSYIISTIIKIYTDSYNKSYELKEKLSKFIIFIKKKGVNNETRFKARIYLEHQIESKNNLFLYENDLSKYLSNDLYSKVKIIFNLEFYNKLGLFNNHIEFVQYLSIHMFNNQFNPCEVIFNKKNKENRDMYFITQGEVILFDEDIIFKTLKRKDYFGEYALFTNKNRTTSAESIKFTNMLSISRKIIKDGLIDYKEKNINEFKYLINEIELCRVAIQTYSLPLLSCYICHKNGHYSNLCSQMKINNVSIRMELRELSQYEKQIKINLYKNKIIKNHDFNQIVTQIENKYLDINDINEMGIFTHENKNKNKNKLNKSRISKTKRSYQSILSKYHSSNNLKSDSY